MPLIWRSKELSGEGNIKLVHRDLYAMSVEYTYDTTFRQNEIPRNSRHTEKVSFKIDYRRRRLCEIGCKMLVEIPQSGIAESTAFFSRRMK